jgi:predicted peptidase
MGWLGRCVVILWVVFFCFGCATGGQGHSKFQTESFVFNGEPHPYAVYTPVNYDSQKPYPAILFLHGLFEGGSDGVSMTRVGIGPAIQKNPERWNCIVIMPQTPSNWQKPESVELASAVLEDAQKKYSIDRRRVVVTGLSNGGAGVWLLGAKYPGRFAGLAPLCAFAEYEAVPNLIQVPVWAFHNSSDWVVSSNDSKKMVEKINQAGGNATLTLYGGFGHDCWTQVYSDPDVVQWLQNPVRK